MAIVVDGELVLDRNETIDLIRNMVQPDSEAIDRRDRFLRDREDIIFSFSAEGIIAECCSIESIEKKPQLYDSQEIVYEHQSDVSYIEQLPGYDYSMDFACSHFSSQKKDDKCCNSLGLTNTYFAKAA